MGKGRERAGGKSPFAVVQLNPEPFLAAGLGELQREPSSSVVLPSRPTEGG